MAKKPRILFVCEDGMSRCQMAEGFARYFAGAAVAVESAGPTVGETDPFCQWAMNEAGIDITLFSSGPLAGKDLSAYTHIVTMGEDARASLKGVPAGIRVEHWALPDPGRVRGRPSDVILSFRTVRNEIEKRVKTLLGYALKQ